MTQNKKEILQSSKYRNLRVFPGCPVVKTLHFHCWGVQVPSLVRELRSCMAKKQTNKKKPNKTNKQKLSWETSLAVQWLRLCAPNAGGQGATPGQGTISHMPQLRPHSMWDLSSPTRDWSLPPVVEAWSPNHWTARKFLILPSISQIKKLQQGWINRFV